MGASVEITRRIFFTVSVNQPDYVRDHSRRWGEIAFGYRPDFTKDEDGRPRPQSSFLGIAPQGCKSNHPET